MFGGNWKKKKKPEPEVKEVSHHKKITDDEIKKALSVGSFVSEEDLQRAEEYSKKNKAPLITLLLKEEIITRDLLGQALAEQFGMSYVDLNSNIPPTDQVKKIKKEIAERERIVLYKDGPEKNIVVTDRSEKDTVHEIAKKIFPKKHIEVAYSLTEDIDSILILYRKSLATRFSRIIDAKERVAPEIIDEILNDALLYRASDVHFEPHDNVIAVRFRIDGVLHLAGQIPKEFYENILNRIKVQAHFRIDEHNAAQDGAMRFNGKTQKSDIRVSLVPTLDGEKIVMRMLSEYIQEFSIKDLGLSEKNQKILETAATVPFGMIVVCGPTGSGKTTTLYALLKHINRPEVNITTIEDPVEYKLGDANQIQVNTATHLTFAKGLRSIVRQDPDIILVGEIRDEETADIATNAALTGHLLFSTFHANDSATTIPRLLDMGVEPFLLASTLELVIAQRLVRKICESCRISYIAKREDIIKKANHIKKYFASKQTLYKGKGCNACNHTGFRGRIAIFEMMPITKDMEELILTNPSTNEIWKLARKLGVETLFEDGLAKVFSGTTTIDELLRVARPEEV